MSEDAFQELDPKILKLQFGEYARQAQEQAITAGGLTFVDLPGLSALPEFNEPVLDSEPETLDAIPSGIVWELNEIMTLYSALDVRDQDLLDQHINQFWRQEQDYLGAGYGITELNDLTPSQAFNFALVMVSRIMGYDQEAYQTHEALKAEGKEEDYIRDPDRLKLDTLRPEELLVRQKGVCRHYAKVTVAVFNALKRRDIVGRMKNSTLLPLHSQSLDLQDTPGPHAYVALLVYRPNHGLAVSVDDPTWLLGRDEGRPIDRLGFTRRRLTSALRLLIRSTALRKTIRIDDADLLSVIENQENYVFQEAKRFPRQLEGREINQLINLSLLRGEIHGTRGNENKLHALSEVASRITDQLTFQSRFQVAANTELIRDPIFVKLGIASFPVASQIVNHFYSHPELLSSQSSRPRFFFEDFRRSLEDLVARYESENTDPAKWTRTKWADGELVTVPTIGESEWAEFKHQLDIILTKIPSQGED